MEIICYELNAQFIYDNPMMYTVLKYELYVSGTNLISLLNMELLYDSIYDELTYYL